MLISNKLFAKYLSRMRTIDSLACQYKTNDQDNVEHTFLKYRRWAMEKQEAPDEEDKITWDNIAWKMLELETSWNFVAAFIE